MKNGLTIAAFLALAALTAPAAPFVSEIPILPGERWWGGGGGDGHNQPYGAGDSKRVNLRTHGNTPEHCYIRDAALNGQRYGWSQISREELTEGGVLDLWLDAEPAHGWGQLRFRNSGL